MVLPPYSQILRDKTKESKMSPYFADKSEIGGFDLDVHLRRTFIIPTPELESPTLSPEAWGDCSLIRRGPALYNRSKVELCWHTGS